ncbi:neutral/alkaline non-lysosomal ceramidase N-terminal domain-containing protein [Fulvivirgaceae bacterium BMA10]|uniref:Neutral/alkaline non-lysosomal ceramidase N-terminal domain-containing protein n=1 Tax=Splendidivirga corallicola TaxID=3051826 RepID=A0ABT8KK16_9BACT|nr:neutral/alkaline non-lysosomal ceramidase N-terminal domain-containing protein [Fulvivirgaceae bacterium BMA10]
MRIRKFFKRAFIALILILLLGLVLITRVDRTPYQETDFYQHTISRLDSIRERLQEQKEDSVKVGWARINITPKEPVRLTGNHQKPYEKVLDSVWVSAIVLENHYQKVALLSYDLWIIHPYTADKIREAIKASDLKIEQVYFTASHTHSGYGGWSEGLLGKVVAGGYEKEIIKLLQQRTLEALKRATNKMTPFRAGFKKIAARGFVNNRIDHTAYIDAYLRVMKMCNENFEQGIFSTFSAHATYVDADLNALSPDYPGKLVEHLLTIDSLKFSSFAAGTVGSHSPARERPFENEKMDQYAKQLTDLIKKQEDSIDMQPVTTLKFVQLPVDLREPHFRISNNWRLRPWLFRTLVGEHPSYISCLRIGNTVLIGLPIELSGEFYPMFDKICKERGISLIITTFNGNYIGYVTPAHYYDEIKYRETREMNWYGPNCGEYFVELIERLLTFI